MKKLFCIVLLAASCLAQADGFRHEHHHEYYGGYYQAGGDWVGPAIIGGIIGYELNRPRYNPPVVVQQPVIVQPQPVYSVQSQSCSAWVETQHPDGTITRTRTCTQ